MNSSGVVILLLFVYDTRGTYSLFLCLSPTFCFSPPGSYRRVIEEYVYEREEGSLDGSCGKKGNPKTCFFLSIKIGYNLQTA